MSDEQRRIDDFYLSREADDPVRLSAKERQAIAQERIAMALGRIADALEKQQVAYWPYPVPVPTPPLTWPGYPIVTYGGTSTTTMYSDTVCSG